MRRNVEHYCQGAHCFLIYSINLILLWFENTFCQSETITLARRKDLLAELIGLCVQILSLSQSSTFWVEHLRDNSEPPPGFISLIQHSYIHCTAFFSCMWIKISNIYSAGKVSMSSYSTRHSNFNEKRFCIPKDVFYNIKEVMGEQQLRCHTQQCA